MQSGHKNKNGVYKDISAFQSPIAIMQSGHNGKYVELKKSFDNVSIPYSNNVVGS